MKDLKSTPFWSKPRRVDAIRLTEENIRKVADEIGGDYSWGTDEDPTPSITYWNTSTGSWVTIGQWVAVDAEGSVRFYDHEEFMRKFYTHAERQTEDEKYAKIYALVISAMNRQASATWNGDSNGDMDIVAIETVKKILGEI